MKRQFLMTAFLALWAATAGADEYVLNNTNGPPFTTSRGDGFLDRIAGMAFEKIGGHLRLIELPPERGLLNANAGVEDGDLTRIEGLEAQYPNLIRVPEKLMDWNFSAFSKRKDIQVDGWGSLLSYRVGFIRGWKIAESNLGGAAQVVLVEDEKELFDFVQKDRVDLVIYSREMGAVYVRRKSMFEISLLEPPVATREMYIYLNRKHYAVIPKLAQALRELKADGTYDREYRGSVSFATTRDAP